MSRQKIVGGRIVGGRARSARDEHPLQVVLRDLGLTQSEFAAETGVSAATICRVLTGRDRAFTGRSAFKIKQFLGDAIPVEFLVFHWKE